MRVVGMDAGSCRRSFRGGPAGGSKVRDLSRAIGPPGEFGGRNLRILLQSRSSQKATSTKNSCATPPINLSALPTRRPAAHSAIDIFVDRSGLRIVIFSGLPSIPKPSEGGCGHVDDNYDEDLLTPDSKGICGQTSVKESPDDQIQAALAQALHTDE